MIEVKIPGLRLSGFQGMDTAVAKGVFMYNAGSFTTNHIPIGTPGYAAVGDSPRMLKANGFTHSGAGVFPVNKFILSTQGADQSNDTIPSGARLIYYVQGRYETDEYDITVSGTGAGVGDKLWLNSSGQISLAAGTGADPAGWNLPPIGEIVGISAFPVSVRWYNGGNTSGVNAYKKMVDYMLYPLHAQPVGNQFVSL